MRQDGGNREPAHGWWAYYSFDGGKKVKGRERHLAVDTLGLLLAIEVTAADVSDRTGARLVASQLRGRDSCRDDPCDGQVPTNPIPRHRTPLGTRLSDRQRYTLSTSPRRRNRTEVRCHASSPAFTNIALEASCPGV